MAIRNRKGKKVKAGAFTPNNGTQFSTNSATKWDWDDDIQLNPGIAHPHLANFAV